MTDYPIVRAGRDSLRTSDLPSPPPGAPLAIELFAGAGGLMLGVEAAGYRTRLAVEREPVAVATLNLNRERFFPELGKVRPLDITEEDPGLLLDELGLQPGQAALLAGGPPCVAFSKSGFHLEYKRLGQDPNAALLDHYLRFVSAVQPAAFLMENVPGLAYRNQSAQFFDALVGGLRGLRYSVQWAILNAADYGIPQNRPRLFIIGARDGRPLAFPRPSHWGEHERRRRPIGAGSLAPHVTAAQALAGTNAPEEPEESVNGLYGHLLPEIPPGSNYLHFTEHEGHPQPLFRWRSRYWTFLLKLDPARPASTIQAQPGPYVGPFHWDNRRLRVAELKRLHGFPDDFEFAGTRREVQVQIGNAVPPALARVVADAIRQQLTGVPLTGLTGEPQLALSL
jgi:DNA (cytosine-5)-methyltransferase 1